MLSRNHTFFVYLSALCFVNMGSTIASFQQRMFYAVHPEYGTPLEYFKPAFSIIGCALACLIQAQCHGFCYRNDVTDNNCYVIGSKWGIGPSVGPLDTCRATAQQLPSGFKMYGANAIVRVYGDADEKNYADAKDTCTVQGAHLFRSDSQDAFMTLRAAADGPVNFDDTYWKVAVWTDADDLTTNGEFRWGNGTVLPNESLLWHWGQPDAKAGEDCVNVLLKNAGAQRSLNDCTCHLLFPFVCQLDAETLF